MDFILAPAHPERQRVLPNSPAAAAVPVPDAATVLIHGTWSSSADWRARLYVWCVSYRGLSAGLAALEERVPRDHPRRRIKEVATAVLERLSPEFDRMYAQVGRASVPPKRLPRRRC